MSTLCDFFEKRKIEYYSVIDFSELRVTSEQILNRCSFTPKSAIIFLLPYFSGVPKNISRYARGLDYHLLVKEVTGDLCELLCREYPGSRSHGFGDHSPIDERHAALITGLGILGDNGLIINERYGSYIFVADVLTDIEPLALGAMPPCEISRCNQCGACAAACPTGILRGSSSDCLSAITQRKGELSFAEISLMTEYNTVWGCDECQSVCPYNREPRVTPISFFHKDIIDELTPEYVQSLSREGLRNRAFGWRGRAVLTRNLEKVKNMKKEP